jgi:hypothetical protein
MSMDNVGADYSTETSDAQRSLNDIGRQLFHSPEPLQLAVGDVRIDCGSRRQGVLDVRGRLDVLVKSSNNSSTPGVHYMQNLHKVATIATGFELRAYRWVCVSTTLVHASLGWT